MLKWEFSVSGQSLTRTDRLITNADLVGQLQAEFTLDSWWDDYIVIAQFVRDGVPELRILQNGKCDVPDRVLKGAGIVYISLYAVGFETRKTTNEIYIEVEPSGIRQGSLSPNKPSGDVWQQTLEMLNGLKGGLKGQITSKASDNDYDFEFVDLPEGAPKIQKYTINAEEYYDKTLEDIINVRVRAVAEGLFDVTLAVSVKLVDDAFDNPTPVFANQPISYESDSMSYVVYADLKEIVLYFKGEAENPDTGEMELEESWVNASYFVATYYDNLNASTKFEISGPLSATISARYEGLDNDTAVALREEFEFYNELLKAATLYYVPYEKGDETMAEVSI